MSEGLKFMGKGPDGKGKGVAVNNDGVIKTELTGSNVVKHEFYSPGQISISQGGSYETERFPANKYNALRIALTFNSSIANRNITVEIVEIREVGAAYPSPGAGLNRKVQMDIAGSSSEPDRSLINDSVPLYNPEFFIRINNNSGSSLSLRAMTLTLMHSHFPAHPAPKSLIGNDVFRLRKRFKGEVLTGSAPVIFETDEPIIIDSFVWATNSSSISMSIGLKDEAGNSVFIPMIGADGSEDYGYFRPSLIVNNSDSLFEVNVYDNTLHQYRFTLKEKMNCPHGLVLALPISNRNSDNELQDEFSVAIIGRKV